LSKIKASNPEVLYVGTEDIQMGLIVKQAKALGIEAQISGGNSMATSVFVETAGAEAAEGSIFATTYISKDVSEQARTFAEKYKEKYGKYPDNHGAKAYDGMNMLIEAMRNAHPNIDGPSIREEILKLDYQGVTGHFKFDETGEGMDQLTMGIIRNGKAEVLE
jgi:branched-chain amino acid transport system substrate-binding protein